MAQKFWKWFNQIGIYHPTKSLKGNQRMELKTPTRTQTIQSLKQDDVSFASYLYAWNATFLIVKQSGMEATTFMDG